ncbi:MAG TPA: transketolase [Clostridiaceae bacterium]|nr:transketolase [Clostridiaceae bacterium]
MSKELRDPRKTFGSAVFEAAKTNEDIVVLSADSGGSSGFGEFKSTYPDRYFEFGIMEQGVVGVASGLATTGKIPVFCAIAPFVTSRPYEMFRNDIGYMRQNVKIVGRNGGISYSDLGATHHSLEDFAIIRMIPDVVILSPQDPSEIENAVKAMLDYNGPVYMRIGNQSIPELFESKPFEIGKGNLIRDGQDVAIISTGSLTANVLDAAKVLEDKGYNPMVIGMPTINPIDEELIEYAARKTGKIVTVEEHYIPGGLGSIVSEVCSKTFPVHIKMLGVPKTYATSGPYNEILEFYGLDAKGIVNSVVDFINK